MALEHEQDSDILFCDGILNSSDSSRTRQTLRIISTFLVMSLLVFGSRADDEADEGSADPRNHTCSTLTCEARYKKLFDSVDLTIDPCENFYGHVCAKYTKIETPLDAVIQFLESGNASNHAERQAQVFFESCRNQSDDQQEDQKTEALKDLIEDLGGWQLAGESKNTDLSQLVEKVHNKYGLTLFFSWDVNFEPGNTSSNIILVTPEDAKTGYLNRKGRGDRKEDEAFELYLVEMIKSSGGSEMDHGRLRKLVKDMLLLNEQFRDTLIHGLYYRKISLGELEKHIRFINLTYFFHEPFSKSAQPLTKDARLSVFNTESFDKLSALIEANLKEPERKKAVVAYIKLRALIYWSQNMINKKSSMDSACVEFAFKKLTQVMNSIYVKQTFSNQTNAREEIVEFFDIIRGAFNWRIANMSWLDETTKQNAAGRVENVTLLAGYPDLYLDDAYFDEKYANLSLDPTNFMNNVREIQGFNLREAARKLPLPAVPTDAFDFYHAKETSAFYVRGVNTIFVLARLLQEPYYHDQYPRPVKFATLSFILSRELVHAFFDPNLSTGPDGTWMTRESLNEYRNVSKCFVDQYSQYSFEGTNVNAYAKLDEYISDTTGLALGYEVYRSSTNLTELIEISPQITWDQYYFMEVTHFLCEDPAPFSSVKEMLDSKHSPNVLRVNATLENSFEFNDAFSCYANLTEQCSLLWY